MMVAAPLMYSSDGAARRGGGCAAERVKFGMPVTVTAAAAAAGLASPSDIYRGAKLCTPRPSCYRTGNERRRIVSRRNRAAPRVFLETSKKLRGGGVKNKKVCSPMADTMRGSSDRLKTT